MLIAQCPNCGTSLQVSIEQLQLASGRLQCGECETVFDAEDQLDPASDTVADPLSVEIDLDAEVEREQRFRLVMGHPLERNPRAQMTGLSAP